MEILNIHFRGKLVKVTICAVGFVIFTILVAACGNKAKPGGEVIVRNDILDAEYNSFVVDQIVTDNGLASFKASLKPNDEMVLPFSHISQMRFVRRYEDHSKVYFVTCPKDFNESILVKLIDVHTNRLGGGCRLAKRGRMSLGGLIKWE